VSVLTQCLVDSVSHSAVYPETQDLRSAKYVFSVYQHIRVQLGQIYSNVK